MNIITAQGLGDCIYARPVIKALIARSECDSITTAWPEFFTDLGVPLYRPRNTVKLLRTQEKNAASSSAYTDGIAPEGKSIHYVSDDLFTGKSMLESLANSAGLSLQDIPLMDLPAELSKPDEDYAYSFIARPVTVRTEWANLSRMPRYQYLNWCIKDLVTRGEHVVAVADICPPHEVMVGEDNVAQTKRYAGELSISKLLCAMKASYGVVGGVGWIVPACLALQVPLFCILGGQGKFNAPWHLADEYNLARNPGFKLAVPDDLCMCSDLKHQCGEKKNISTLKEQWGVWLGNT